MVSSYFSSLFPDFLSDGVGPGTRQGCPIRSILFALANDPLTTVIGQDIYKTHDQISLHADDVPISSFFLLHLLRFTCCDTNKPSRPPNTDSITLPENR